MHITVNAREHLDRLRKFNHFTGLSQDPGLVLYVPDVCVGYHECAVSSCRVLQAF